MMMNSLKSKHYYLNFLGNRYQKNFQNGNYYVTFSYYVMDNRKPNFGFCDFNLVKPGDFFTNFGIARVSLKDHGHKIVVILKSCSIRWKVLATNLPSKKIFRASKSNSFYLVLLLFMLLVIMLPIVYSMSINASKRCGPYSTIDEVEKSYQILNWTIKSINVSGFILDG